MNTSIANRNAAYRQIQEDLPAKRRRVYEAIRFMGKATAQQVARYLQVPINEVTGRITELRDKHGVLRECGSLKNKRTGKPNTLYSVIL